MIYSDVTEADALDLFTWDKPDAEPDATRASAYRQVLQPLELIVDAVHELNAEPVDEAAQAEKPAPQQPEALPEVEIALSADEATDVSVAQLS